MKLQQSVLEMQLSPFITVLRAVLEQLKEKDQAKIFAQPVNIKEVRLTYPFLYTFEFNMGLFYTWKG